MEKNSPALFLTAACCSGYLVIGLVFSLIGVGLESFAAQVDSSAAEVGSLFYMFLASGTFLMLFAVGPAIDRFGQRPVLVGGALLCAVGSWLMVESSSLPGACALMFLMGAGSAGLNGGSNTLINHLYSGNSERALNLGNLFFGLGAVTMPLAGGWLITSAGIGALLKLAAAGCLLPLAMFAFAPFPSGVRVKNFRLADAGKAAGDKLVVLFCIVIFLYVGMESSMGVWSRPTVAGKWDLKPPLDQLVLAGYWGALMIGRLLAATLFHEMPGRKLVLRCALGSLISLTVFSMASSLYVAVFALWFSGLCFGPVFPSSLGSAGRVFTNYTGTIFSLIISSSVLGGIVITAVVGTMVGTGFLRMALLFVAGCAAMMLFIQLKISRGVERRLAAASLPAADE